MRLLYLALDINLDDVSGDAIHVHEVTRALASLGVEVHLVVPDLAGKKQRSPALEKSGVVIHSIAVSGDIGTALACRRLAAGVIADVVFERRFSPKVGVAVSRACARPLIVEVNALPDVEMEILQKPIAGFEFATAVKSRLRKFLYARVDRFVTVTPGLAQAMQTRYGIPPGRFVIIPNGADVEVFRTADLLTAKEALGIPSSQLTVGFVGTLYPWHGLHHLLSAAPEIVRRSPDVLFVIVGNGPERKRLEDAAMKSGLKDSFLFVGRVEHGQVPRYIQAFDICVHPVATELYSVKYGSSALKLYEYLACGRSVVAARYPGFEVLEEVDCGLLVNPQDPLEFSAAILSLLRDPVRKEEMGSRARIVAVERYSWKSVAERLLAVMRETTR